MYQTFAAGFSSYTLKVVYMFATYLLWGSVCYTCINIPYGSMASVMSNEPDHRASLSTFRGVGSMIPQILVGVVVPMFLYTTLDDGTKIANASAFPVVALVTAILAAVCYIICYFMCTERVKVSEESKSVSFADTIKALAGNRALIGISLVFICYLGAQMLNQTINNYIFKDYFGDTMGLSVMNAAGFAPALILAPCAVPLARKFGKKELGIFALIFLCSRSFKLFKVEILRISPFYCSFLFPLAFSCGRRGTAARGSPKRTKWSFGDSRVAVDEVILSPYASTPSGRKRKFLLKTLCALCLLRRGAPRGYAEQKGDHRRWWMRCLSA
jgi:Na+/melibiose symporter-like transporter